MFEAASSDNRNDENGEGNGNDIQELKSIDTRFQTVAVLGKHIKKFDKIITDINILVKLVEAKN